MTVEGQKAIAIKMIEDFASPEVAHAYAPDFQFSIEADPGSHKAAERPQTAEELVRGWARVKELFRYPDDGPAGVGLRHDVRTVTGEGNRVAVEGTTIAVLKSDPARVFKNQGVLVFEFRDDQVVRLRVYDDTAYVRSFWGNQNDDIVSQATGG